MKERRFSGNGGECQASRALAGVSSQPVQVEEVQEETGLPLPLPRMHWPEPGYRGLTLRAEAQARGPHPLPSQAISRQAQKLSSWDWNRPTSMGGRRPKQQPELLCPRACPLD